MISVRKTLGIIGNIFLLPGIGTVIVDKWEDSITQILLLMVGLILFLEYNPIVAIFVILIVYIWSIVSVLTFKPKPVENVQQGETLDSAAKNEDDFNSVSIGQNLKGKYDHLVIDDLNVSETTDKISLGERVYKFVNSVVYKYTVRIVGILLMCFILYSFGGHDNGGEQVFFVLSIAAVFFIYSTPSQFEHFFIWIGVQGYLVRACAR